VRTAREIDNKSPTKVRKAFDQEIQVKCLQEKHQSRKKFGPSQWPLQIIIGMHV